MKKSSPRNVENQRRFLYYFSKKTRIILVFGQHFRLIFSRRKNAEKRPVKFVKRSVTKL